MWCVQVLKHARGAVMLWLEDSLLLTSSVVVLPSEPFGVMSFTSAAWQHKKNICIYINTHQKQQRRTDKALHFAHESTVRLGVGSRYSLDKLPFFFFCNSISYFYRTESNFFFLFFVPLILNSLLGEVPSLRLCRDTFRNYCNANKITALTRQY